MKKYITIIILAVVGISCASHDQTIWTDFRSEEIISKKLDHGPYGGITEIKWNKGKNEKPFDAEEIIKFGLENNIEYYTEFDNYKHSNGFMYEILTQRFDTSEIVKSRILIFKSELLTIDEDRNFSTDKNCFLILNEQKDEMVCYFQWGDF